VRTFAEDGQEVSLDSLPFVNIVEAEVNDHWGELVLPNFEDKLLTLQLRRIAMCIDLCNNKDASSNILQRKLSFDAESGTFLSRVGK